MQNQTKALEERGPRPRRI